MPDPTASDDPPKESAAAQKPGDPPQPSLFTPFAGCWLGLAILLFALFFIGWFVYSGYEQDKAIAQFTAPEPVKLPAFTPTDAQIAAADAKLDAFKAAVEKEEAAELVLTAEDLNTLIASKDKLKGWRGTVFFTNIGGGVVTAQVTMPMRTLPWNDGERHLNGEIDFLPTTGGERGKLQVRANAIRVPGKSVEPHFTETFSLQLQPLSGLHEDEATKPIIQAISDAIIEDGKVRLIVKKP